MWIYISIYISHIDIYMQIFIDADGGGKRDVEDTKIRMGDAGY